MQPDVIVIGAGHNGLVAAGALARRGRRVLVLERAAGVGGLCAGEAFHEGYRTAGIHHDTATLRSAVVRTLDLPAHGLELRERAPAVYAARPADSGSPTFAVDPDAERAREALARAGVADAAVEGYARWRAFIARVRDVVAPMLSEEPPDLTDLSMGNLMELAQRAMAVRRLGAGVMLELMRIPPMAVGDWLRESVPDERVDALLAGPAVAGTWCGPWSPGTAANLLLRECTAGPGVRGGAAALTTALANAARDLGVTVRTGAAVRRIRVADGAVRGVTLEDGEEIDAPVVVSTADPKTTFLDLLHPHDPPHAFVREIEAFRMRGTTAHVALALDRRFELPGARGRVVLARTGETLDALERAFDAVKYRRVASPPWLDVYVPSAEAEGYAPAGCDSVSVLVHFAPFDLEGGWDDAQRERLGDAVVDELERHAPGLRAAVVGRRVLTPADIAARWGIHGGHVHHGEHALDQLVVRPTPGAARHRTPIGGLFLGGSGAFPGGGVTGAPGLLAAIAAMRGA